MKKEKPIEMEGTVIQSLPNVMFRVELDKNGAVILAHPSGNMKRNFIKVIEGDRVKVEMSPYDLTMGRISKRLNKA